MQLGLNRLDYRSPAHFAHDARRAQDTGWAWAFIPDSQLNLPDPWVMLAAAAGHTTTLGLGVLVTNPVIRHPSAVAASVATLEHLAPGRTLCAYGVGDTAVRLAGLRPARVADIEAAVRLTRELLRGDAIDPEATHPSHLRAARLQPQGAAPIWVAAGGPRTLRAAGRVAEGVFIRVGAHPQNLRRAVDAVHQGARDAGRDPASVRLGCVIHTVLVDDAVRAARIGKAIAAGFYEYAPYLFDAPHLVWDGPPIDALKRRVWPDFHHAADLDAAAALVHFLPDTAADDFALHGPPTQVATRLEHLLSLGIDFDILVPHPVPPPPPPGDASPSTYMRRFIDEVARPLGL